MKSNVLLLCLGLALGGTGMLFASGKPPAGGGSKPAAPPVPVVKRSSSASKVTDIGPVDGKPVETVKPADAVTKPRKGEAVPEGKISEVREAEAVGVDGVSSVRELQRMTDFGGTEGSRKVVQERDNVIDVAPRDSNRELEPLFESIVNEGASALPRTPRKASVPGVEAAGASALPGGIPSPFAGAIGSAKGPSRLTAMKNTMVGWKTKAGEKMAAIEQSTVGQKIISLGQKARINTGIIGQAIVESKVGQETGRLVDAAGKKMTAAKDTMGAWKKTAGEKTDAIGQAIAKSKVGQETGRLVDAAGEKITTVVKTAKESAFAGGVRELRSRASDKITAAKDSAGKKMSELQTAARKTLTEAKDGFVAFKEAPGTMTVKVLKGVKNAAVQEGRDLSKKVSEKYAEVKQARADKKAVDAANPLEAGKKASKEQSALEKEQTELTTAERQVAAARAKEQGLNTSIERYKAAEGAIAERLTEALGAGKDGRINKVSVTDKLRAKFGSGESKSAVVNAVRAQKRTAKQTRILEKRQEAHQKVLAKAEKKVVESGTKLLEQLTKQEKLIDVAKTELVKLEAALAKETQGSTKYTTLATKVASAREQHAILEQAGQRLNEGTISQLEGLVKKMGNQAATSDSLSPSAKVLVDKLTVVKKTRVLDAYMKEGGALKDAALLGEKLVPNNRTLAKTKTKLALELVDLKSRPDETREKEINEQLSAIERLESANSFKSGKRAEDGGDIGIFADMAVQAEPRVPTPPSVKPPEAPQLPPPPPTTARKAERMELFPPQRAPGMPQR